MEAAAVLAGRTVMQVVPALDAGGVERTTVDIAAALVRAGARALVASRGGRLAGELAAAGAELLPLPAMASKNPAVMAAAVPRLAALIREERVDIVHARSRAPAWVALAAARRTRTPFVTTWHGAYSGRTALKHLYNSVMARGDAVIANSRWTAEQIAARHPWARPRLVVIPRGTELARFAAPPDPDRVAALRARWGVAPDRRVVLIAARLTAWKGHILLLEALARLRAEGQAADVVAVFAGDAQGRDDYAAAIDTRAAELGLGEAVRRVGHEGDIATALHAADVVAVPSTRPEAFGRVAVEAQAAGVPVVVSDHGAPTETVLAPPAVAAAARTGWRVAPGDAAALAEGLAAALALGPAERGALAARARAHVAGYSVEAMAAATLAVYAGLLVADAS
jgi:glycosyltransferase involved in cell wall biosynthesis